MLVSITSSSPDATDLGWVLHKHPDRMRSVDVGFGTAHVFYPESSAERCTATLMVEIDPIALSRRTHGKQNQTLEPYVNDRPYAASSMLSVAIGRLYGSAMSGSCANRPDLVDTEMDLTVHLPVVPVRGGVDVLERLFVPLGYTIEATALPLDDQFSEWGDSRYMDLTLRTSATVQRVLQHLFVLIPVLDDRKHYWIGSAEVEKLLSKGGDWLPSHPEREFITRRYLRFGGLAREAMARLNESVEDQDDTDRTQDSGEEAIEKPISLNVQRLDAVTAAVVAAGGGSVMDLGCGEGRLLERLLAESSVSSLLGVDVSIATLDRAERRLRMDEWSDRRREQVRIVQGALTYADDRLKDFDVATVIEVIEHIDSDRLDAFAQALFGHAAPASIVMTTPNSEYNIHFDGMEPGSMRHGDHRFEWTRAEFEHWAGTVADQYGYSVSFSGIGSDHAETGAPTQMAVFTRGASS